jgi:putative ATP-dependent endonuclease of OLD family
MRIASITLKNFRAFRGDTTIQLFPFSAIVGRNDSGKSSILHALDIFFNRSPDLDDFTIGMSIDEQMEITVRFTNLLQTIQDGEGVDTTLLEENLLDGSGCLAIKKVYTKWIGTRPPSPEIRLLVLDFSEDDFQNLCSRNERDLNKLGEAAGLDFSRAGRGVTNRSKREALREKAKANGVAIGQVEYKVSNDLWRSLNSYVPSFSLFIADWRLSEEETGFQNEFKGMIEDATQGKAERGALETFIEQYIDQEVAKIHGFLLKHTEEVSSLKVRPQFKWKDLVSFRIEATDRDGVPVLLRKRGAGLRRLLMVAYFQYLAARSRVEAQPMNHVFGIEEPETYLHPGAQRVLLDSLKAIASSNQVLITTHSPVFAGATEQEALVWTKKTQGAVVVLQGRGLDMGALALDLGIEPSDQIYGYRACVFVEGYDDVDFLTSVALKLKEDGHLAETFMDKQIGLIPVGGCGNLKLWINRRAMRSLSKKYGLFADSDIQCVGGCLSQEKLGWKQECEADGAVVHFTRKREIENYLHKDVILRVTRKTTSLDDFCDVKAMLGDGCSGLIQHMSSDQILECDRWVDDAGNEHHELLEAIKSFLAIS